MATRSQCHLRKQFLFVSGGVFASPKGAPSESRSGLEAMRLTGETQTPWRQLRTWQRLRTLTCRPAAPTWGVTGKVRYLSQVSREHCAPCRSTERPQGKERGLASDSALGTGPSAKPASRGRNLYGKKKLRQSAGGWRRSTMTEASDEAVLCGRSLHRKRVVTLLKRRAPDGIRKRSALATFSGCCAQRFLLLLLDFISISVTASS